MGALPASRQDADQPRTRLLHAVPDLGDREHEQFMANLTEGELVEDATDWKSGPLDDATLLAFGLPVAVPYGDRVPDVVDETADVHDAAVVNIELARLRRYLVQLPGLERKVLELRFGIGCEPLSQAKVAERVGLSRQHVPRVERRGLQMLQEYFGVEVPLTA